MGGLKRRKQLARLKRRIAAWERLPLELRRAMRKPGSNKK